MIPVDSLVDCRCQPGDCVSALFRRGSLAGVTSEDRLRDLLAITGEYADAVASTKRKTVRFWYDRDGSMQFAIDLPDNDRGRRFMELFDTVDTFARPVIDTAASEFTKDGAVAVYARAEVRALTLGPTDAAAGWTPLRELTGPDDDLPNNLPAPAPEPRRRIWL